MSSLPSHFQPRPHFKGLPNLSLYSQPYFLQLRSDEGSNETFLTAQPAWEPGRLPRTGQPPEALTGKTSGQARQCLRKTRGKGVGWLGGRQPSLFLLLVSWQTSFSKGGRSGMKTPPQPLQQPRAGSKSYSYHLAEKETEAQSGKVAKPSSPMTLAKKKARTKT